MSREEHPATARAFTLRSVAATIFVMVVMATAVDFSGMIEGSARYFGSENLPFPAVGLFIALSVLSSVMFVLVRRRLLTKEELFCVLFASMIACPLMGYGGWRYIMGRTSTIPRSADFQKLDAFEDKLWPHGPNLTAGFLDTPGHAVTAYEGGFQWSDVEVDIQRIASLPTLCNTEPDQRSHLRVRLPLKSPHTGPLIPGQPHILSVLVKARDLGPESRYYCRIYYDQSDSHAEEAFASSETGKRTYLHKTGFRRIGVYGLVFSSDVEHEIYFELGLVGPGTVSFRDLRLMNVSALDEAYEGAEVLSAADVASLPERQRIGLGARPDAILSPSGLRFLLTAYLPLREWWIPATVWTVYVFLVLGAGFALAVIMRRQWIDRERFLLPLTYIPRALLGVHEERDRAVPAIWKNRIMWTGFAAALLWCLLRAWVYHNPGAPNLNIQIPLKAYFPSPALGATLNGVYFEVFALFLSIAIFMDLNVLMSLFVGFALFRLQSWVGESYGLTVKAGFPFQRQQVIGAFFTYGVLVVFFARKYLWGVLREALSGAQISNEVLSPRAALILFGACFLGIAVWSQWVGLPLAPTSP